ncbi:MAG: family 10 glycosylhydrolase [Armatimonadetes bacterium]|nr:family 10 glycosylhydrolase [Armatimonadota bacterium]
MRASFRSLSTAAGIALCLWPICTWAQPATTATTQLGLWVDGTQAPVAVGEESPFLKGLGEAGAKVQRIIVTVFANGETVFPIKSEVFRQNLLYRTGKDPFAAFLRKADEMGIEVYAAFELLQWVRPGSASQKDVFARHPELQELNAQFGCKGVEEGKFASPFNTDVRTSLLQLVESFARRYPSITGIVLSCRLSYGEVLGYGEAARVAYIRQKQIDPIDLILGTGEEEMESLVREWYLYKRDQISRLVGEIGSAYKGINPKGKVLAVGSANFYRQKLGLRNLTCQDWLHWMEQGYLDEMLLEETWSDAKNDKLWKASHALVRKASKQAPLTPVLRPESDLAAEMKALAEQSKPDRVVLMTSSKSDLPTLIESAEKAVPVLAGQTNP